MKKGKEGVLRYEAVLEPAPGTDLLELRLEKLEFLELAGVDLRGPEGRKKLGAAAAAMLALMGGVPPLRVTKDGHAAGVVGLEETIEKMIRVFEAMNPGASPAAAEATRAAMSSPEVLAMLEQKMLDFWRAWVETWLEMDLGPGDAGEGTIGFPLPDGSVVPAVATLRNHGPEPDAAGHVHLSFVTVLEGAEAKAAMARFLAKLAAGGPKPFPADALEEFRKETRLEAVTDLATLKPLRCETEATTTIAIRGEGRKTETERHEYTFEWPK